VIIDTQDYRSRRERSLERMAAQAADRVRRNRESVLLEPLNPFERRIVHTAIARRGDVETESEGEGLYKRIRVSLKGGSGNGGRRDGGSNGGGRRRRGGRGRDRGGRADDRIAGYDANRGAYEGRAEDLREGRADDGGGDRADDGRGDRDGGED
jgi:hypothetical protein